MHSTAKVVTGVDTHAHIFQRDLPLVEGRRYSPDYDAKVETYLAHLDRCGLSHGVLVQPSFLGTDNDYLVAALRRYPERLRGTAVVEPTISAAALDALDAAGVVSVRLNLIGKALDDYAAAPWQRFFTELARRRWSVEIQRGMEDLDDVVAPILGAGCDVVIDHFGLPGGEIDPVNPAHRALLSRLAHQPLWVKLSATYRSRSSLDQASRSIERLRDAYGHSENLLWGSDWPHTRFEADTDYDAQFALLEKLLPDPQERRQVLVDNPARLFRIALGGDA
ncbi:amidohydrolase [Salinicola sp. DM10]|uniref:amidohydrolase family protein n=1 Tax=Salinicola sp. DM10 TaxID=2815721 RepID=UPI001E5ACAC3|nr:amidohydrolase family protein [Salinicola sp. DM10]MCE3028671.1 amidohydrolase family protein [Salinicola sp. DM10]